MNDDFSFARRQKKKKKKKKKTGREYTGEGFLSNFFVSIYFFIKQHTTRATLMSYEKNAFLSPSSQLSSSYEKDCG